MTDDSVGKGNKQRLIIYNQSAVSFSALTTKNFPLLKLTGLRHFLAPKGAENRSG